MEIIVRDSHGVHMVSLKDVLAQNILEHIATSGDLTAATIKIKDTGEVKTAFINKTGKTIGFKNDLFTIILAKGDYITIEK